MSFDGKKFCQTYFDCWVKAMSDGANEKYNLNSEAWTAFHMKQILYPFAESLDIREIKYKYSSCPKIHEVGRECPKNCKCGYGDTWAQEYYRVDFSMYYHPETYKWCVDFFIEHENAHFEIKDGKVTKKGWLDEFNKLLPLNCSDLGARVIISYDNFKDIKNKILFLENILTNKDSIARQSLVNKPILIILGPAISNIKSNPSTDFFIIEFKYENGTWIKSYGYVEEFIGESKTRHIFEEINKSIKKKN